MNCVWFQFHAEVYFDQEQQSYMLVDQGSQNGTVINGNRILQVTIFSQSLLTLNETVKPQLGNDKPFVCSPKPSVSHMHWCTAMRWRWERLCCPSISTLGLIPVMAVSLVRWWLTSASTGGRRRQVRHQWYIDSKFVKAGLNSAICIFYS